MTYDTLQFIGYTINTFPKRTAAGQTYLGLADAKEDIDARCQLMLRAIQTADNAIASSSPPGGDDCLKVFMAPEFFFRGEKGAYSLDDVQYAVEKLQKIAADDQWKNWLFIFGTIVGFWDQADPTLNKKVINYALIQEGGIAASGPDGARIVTKELMSGIDFIQSRANPGGLLLAGVDHVEAGPPVPGGANQRVTYDGGGIFDTCGIHWAGDICLDHLSGTLIASPQYPGEKEVQVQLVPSAGASIDEDNIVAAKGGYIFNVDSNSPPSATLQKVAPAPNIISPIAIVPMSDDPLTLDNHSPVEEIDIDQIYCAGPGKLSIYSPVDTPEEKTVAGTVKSLHWDSDKGMKFDFDIIYREGENEPAVMCKVTSPEFPQNGNHYILPLDMYAVNNRSETLEMTMKIKVASGPYSSACYCTIDSQKFDFSGNAFLFSNKADGPDPLVAW